MPNKENKPKQQKNIRINQTPKWNNKTNKRNNETRRHQKGSLYQLTIKGIEVNAV